MSERTGTEGQISIETDDLALFAQDIETSLVNQDFSTVANLMEQDPAASWFSLGPSRSYEILRLVLQYLSEKRPLKRIARVMLDSTSTDRFDDPAFLSTVNFEDPREVFVLSMLRMGDYRLNGR